MVMQNPYSQWLMQNSSDNSLYGDLLEEEPELAYYGQLAGPQGRQLTPNQWWYFQNNFGDYRNQYLGELGASLYGGQLPTQKFTDYLNRQPFTERYANLPPSLRRRSGTGFAPPTRLRLRR